jgi:hypothetical protein
MKSKRIWFLLIGVAAWISLLPMITTTYGASIVIGGDYTDIGTIVVISPKPGNTPQANGTALLNTLAGITSDVNNRYLLKLSPGIYDIGTSSLQMKQYVDMEGSGENTTIITGHIDSQTSGVVRGASRAEIRFLTVRNTGGGTDAVAIYNTSASPKITNVTAYASGGSYNYGVFNNSSSSPTMTNMTALASGGNDSYGVINISSSPTMTTMTASASDGTANFGVYNMDSSSPTMTNMTASASGGSISDGVSDYGTGTIKINNSVIIGSRTLINGTNTTTLVANTKLDGDHAVNAIGATVTCVGAYNGNYVALNTSCQ